MSTLPSLDHFKDSNSRTQLLYYSFVEACRQVAVVSKDLAYTLVRAWHAYHQHLTHSYQHNFDQARSVINNISSHLANLQ